MNINSGEGNLKIRATTASEALPISNLKIVVSTIVDNYKIIFFDGVTDSSGMITNLSLPAPVIDADNLIVPNTITYEIEAGYMGDNVTRTFNINMYDGICAVQNITLIPSSKRDDVYGD